MCLLVLTYYLHMYERCSIWRTDFSSSAKIASRQHLERSSGGRGWEVMNASPSSAYISFVMFPKVIIYFWALRLQSCHPFFLCLILPLKCQEMTFPSKNSGEEKRIFLHFLFAGCQVAKMDRKMRLVQSTAGMQSLTVGVAKKKNTHTQLLL